MRETLAMKRGALRSDARSPFPSRSGLVRLTLPPRKHANPEHRATNSSVLALKSNAPQFCPWIQIQPNTASSEFSQVGVSLLRHTILAD